MFLDQDDLYDVYSSVCSSYWGLEETADETLQGIFNHGTVRSTPLPDGFPIEIRNINKKHFRVRYENEDENKFDIIIERKSAQS